jgi:hypothetical protein
MTKKDLKPRRWTRSHRRTQFHPREILIAGEDYECPSNHPLRDAPSEEREAIDPWLLNQIREKGFIDVVKVVAREVPGYDDAVPVAINNRRGLRHARIVSDEREVQELDPLIITIELHNIDDDTAFERSRLLNRGGMPETPTQEATYAVWYMEKNHSLEQAAALLRKTPKALERILSLNSCCEEIRRAVDKGEIGVVAAEDLSKLPFDKQRKAFNKLVKEGSTSRATTRTVVANARGQRARVSPGKKKIRASIKEATEAGIRLSDDFLLAVRWCLGEVEEDQVFRTLTGGVVDDDDEKEHKE